MKKIVFFGTLLFLLWQGIVFAQSSFIVKRIEIEGLHRIPIETVRSYLPIKEGEMMRRDKTPSIIRALFQTRFFDQVRLFSVGNTLIIRVVERPTIGELKIKGNSVVPTDKLTEVMKSLDVAEGRVYDRAMLDKIRLSLLNQYYQLGRYNARVDIKVSDMSRNRVRVRIDISEGLVARVRHISIIGNKAFKERKLLRVIGNTISTPGLFTFLTQKDRYAEQKLEESLEALRNFYLDRGYVRFAVKSSEAEVTPDRKAVYITIAIEEGEVYTVKGYELTGQFVIPKATLLKLINIKEHEVFSRQKVFDIEKKMSNLMGDKGYLFSRISLRPEFDDEARTIYLIFDIDAGKRTYVREITFSDNTRTNDVVLRRELEQFEAAPASTAKLEESKHRLSLLPYIKDVQMSVNPVPTADNEVDVNYKIKEENASQASFKIGYSQFQKFIIGAGLNQTNFLGTGKTLGINLTRSKYEQFYGIDYTDPYYTEDGISRSFNFSLSRTDPGSANISNGFITNLFNAGVSYSIPLGSEIGVFNRLQIGFNYQNTVVHLIDNKYSQEVATFVARHGRHFQEVDIKAGFSRNSLDRSIFPTNGTFQSFFVDAYLPLDKNSLTFYTLNYNFRVFYPLFDDFILVGRTDLGYGNGLHGVNDFPFFQNYYAGGIDSVRGYKDYTLGPLDSNENPFGGNILADASIGIIFPNYISDNLRTTAFFDIGNVYSSIDNAKYGGGGRNSGPLRYSIGLQGEYLFPLLGGPIRVSVAMPLNFMKATQTKHGDFKGVFQFALGASF